LAKRIVLVGFSVFCSNCAQPIVPAEEDYRVGEVMVCYNCDDEVETMGGITVKADDKADLEWTFEQMKVHRELVERIMAQRFGPNAEI